MNNSYHELIELIMSPTLYYLQMNVHCPDILKKIIDLKRTYDTVYGLTNIYESPDKEVASRNGPVCD